MLGRLSMTTHTLIVIRDIKLPVSVVDVFEDCCSNVSNRAVVWLTKSESDKGRVSQSANTIEVFSKLQTLKTQVVEDKPELIVFKLQQEYTPIVLHKAITVNSLVSLSLDGEGKVRYHKDMWNEKDYSHEGLGKLLKTLNGDQLTKITKPPETL